MIPTCSQGWEPLSPTRRSKLTSETPGHHPGTKWGYFPCIRKTSSATWRNTICMNSRLLSWTARGQRPAAQGQSEWQNKAVWPQYEQLQTSKPRQLRKQPWWISSQEHRHWQGRGRRGTKDWKSFQTQKKHNSLRADYFLKTAHILLPYNLRCLKGRGKCHNAFHQYQHRHLIKISSNSI